MMHEPAPTIPIGTMVHHADIKGGPCRAAVYLGNSEYGNANLAVFFESGMTFLPAWYPETENDHGWHLIH